MDKSKVLSFMEEVELDLKNKEEDDNFRNSEDYKLRLIDAEKAKGRGYCLDNIISNIYRDAVPLSDEYKNNCCNDLDSSFQDFMALKCPKGIEWYVREGIKKGSPFAKKVLEAVTDLIDNEYQDKALNIDDTPTDDLVFKSNDDVQNKIDVISKDLSSDEISQIVKDNVKNTAISEIRRAKEEKETLKNLERELAGDASLNTQEAVDEALALRGITETKEYEPTLFEAVMINKHNKLERSNLDTSSMNVYRALSPFTESASNESPSLDEVAFIEAVKEYTALSVLNALKLENYRPSEKEELARQYAQA